MYNNITRQKYIVSAYNIIVAWPARPSSPINLIYYTDFVGNVLISFIWVTTYIIYDLFQ